MYDQRWPKDNPDFWRIKNLEYSFVIEGSENISLEFYDYAVKFKSSAHILIEHILESREIRELDTYFFSLTYLYRHSLELILKAIGLRNMSERNKRQEFIDSTRHNLSLLLDYISSFIKDIIAFNERAFRWVESLFEDMDDIDKKSDAFRYPFGFSISRDTFGDKQYHIEVIFDEQKSIGLVNLAKKMELAFDILASYYFKKHYFNADYIDLSPTLLEEGGGYYTQSVIGYAYNKEIFSPFIIAYRESADSLIDYVCKNPALKETYFFPMCYLYRNAVELAMKEILFEESSLTFQEAIKVINDKKHSVQAIWNKIKHDVIEHAGASDEDETILLVEKYISKLQGIDGKASKFRYPINKNFELHLPKKKKVDMLNVSNFFKELLNFLDAVCAMMSRQNEALADLKNDMY